MGAECRPPAAHAARAVLPLSARHRSSAALGRHRPRPRDRLARARGRVRGGARAAVAGAAGQRAGRSAARALELRRGRPVPAADQQGRADHARASGASRAIRSRCCSGRWRTTGWTHDPALPVPFQTGVVGCLGYDLAHHLERLPHPALDDLALPGPGGWGSTTRCWRSTAVERRAWMLSSGWPEATPAASMHRRKARADQLAALAGASAASRSRCRRCAGEVAVRSNFSRVGLRGGGAAGGRLHPGRRHLPGQPVAALPRPSCRPGWTRGGCTGGCGSATRRRSRPILDFGEVAIASASPERFLELRGRQVETRPIKGTRPRGATPEEDRAARGGAAGQREGPGRERDDRRPAAQRPAAGSAATTPC